MLGSEQGPTPIYNKIAAFGPRKPGNPELVGTSGRQSGRLRPAASPLVALQAAGRRGVRRVGVGFVEDVLDVQPRLFFLGGD